jgi:hypothetical protein
LYGDASSQFSLVVRKMLDIQDTCIGHGSDSPDSRPPRSPDLNPTDFSLCGYMKNLDYANIDTRAHLWRRIQDATNEFLTTPGVLKSFRA